MTTCHPLRRGLWYVLQNHLYIHRSSVFIIVFEYIEKSIYIDAALAIQIFLVRQKNADAKQLFLYLCLICVGNFFFFICLRLNLL